MIIPPPIDVITAPEFFSPSQLGPAGTCLLRGIMAGAKGKIPKLLVHPAAELGSTFHRLLEKAIKGQLVREDTDPETNVRNTLTELLEEAKSRLQGDPKKAHYSDLKTTVTPLEWRRKVRTVVDAAVRMGENPKVSISERGSPLSYSDLSGSGLWSEVGIRVPRLRLEGRMDVIERTSQKVVVRDLKTGRIVDDTGEVLPAIRSQMNYYGIMVAEFEPTKSIYLVLDSADEVNIPFGRSKAKKIEEEWSETLGRVPPGCELQSIDMATLGEDCGKCSYRHICPVYLLEVPSLWRAGADFRLPYDIWGTVVSVRRHGSDNSEITLVDEAGRNVKISRLRDLHAADIKKDDKIWLFGLSTTDRGAGKNGGWHHPLNFHENPEGVSDPRAWCLDVFLQ